MANKSWEIIVAGLLLLLVAIFITSKSDENETNYEREEAVATQRATSSENNSPSKPGSQSQAVTVINFEELAEVKNLKEIEELRSLEGLEKLKDLAALIPAEAKQDIMNELNAALSELEDDSFTIDINIDDKLVFLKKEYGTTLGEWGNISPGVYAYTEEFDLSEIEDVSVQMSTGSVILIGSDDTKATLTVKASGKIAAKELLKDMVSVSGLKNGQKAEFRIRNDKSGSSNIQLQTTLTLPSTIDLVSFTDAGHIEATNFKGDVEFKTSGGHITLKELYGDITAFTQGGHIKISDSEGEASLKSLGGHLTAENFSGDLEMSTSGGNIRGKKLSGGTNAFSSGGNIILQFNSVTGEIQARNGAGQIELTLPSDINADITANGTKVDLASDFVFAGSRKKNQVIGKLGKGGHEIVAKTGYGSVQIRKNE